VTSVSIVGGVSGSPGSRACCLLAPSVVGSRIIEASEITAHVYGNGGLMEGKERWGIVYTCGAGFIDVAHMRDMIDLTKFYHTTLVTNSKVGDKFRVYGGAKDRGDVVIKKAITTPVDQTAVAMSIAYDQSIWHEIVSYWECEQGMHPSSFSPEDLVSNKFGVYIGGKIVTAADFNKQAVTEMTKLLTTLGAVNKTQTQAAFTAIEGTWVDHGRGKLGALRFDYLRSRNFTYNPVAPWILPGFAPCAGSTASVPADFTYALDTSARSFYTLTFTVPSNARSGNPKISIGRGDCFASTGTTTMAATSVATTDYDAQIKLIKDAARLQYGANFDHQ
jgi:hypothetical protein